LFKLEQERVDEIHGMLNELSVLGPVLWEVQQTQFGILNVLMDIREAIKTNNLELKKVAEILSDVKDGANYASFNVRERKGE
jgi:hypothetical protein